MPTPNGYILTWNTALAAPLQYEWQEPAASINAPTIFHPVGRCTIDLPVATFCGTGYTTTEVSEEARAIYLGRAQKSFTAARLVVDVTQDCTKCDWAEAAIMKGTPVLCNGPASLTVLKAQSAMVEWAAVGPQYTDFNVSIAAGDHLWFAWCVKFGVGDDPSFRAFLADDKLSGLTVFRSAVRLTTLAGANDFSRLGATTRTVDSLVGCS